MNVVGIATACAVEADRQGVGLEGTIDLIRGWTYAQTLATFGPPGEFALMELAYIIEPTNDGAFRNIPVTFANGGGSCGTSVVPEGIRRLWEMIPAVIELAEEDDDSGILEFVKNFLWIHPFTDGNGRIAFVLLNWLLGTLDDPVPLPDFGW